MKKIVLALSLFLVMCITFITVGVVHAKTTQTTTTTNEVVNYVYVDVKGEVLNPGVYRVSDKCRIFQVLEIAGGLSGNSDTSNVNLAARVIDEQVIKIPKKDSITNTSITDLININTATLIELDSLPGIGYSTASNIIEYRTTNGIFRAKEDIKLVNGIGDVVYEQIKDLITVW